jgi:hypothetical protein
VGFSHHLFVIFCLLAVAPLTLQASSPSFAEERGGISAQSKPAHFVDLNGNKIETVDVGQQIMIMLTYANYNHEPQPFLAVIEVRGSNGITQYIAWQTAVMPPATDNQTGDEITMGFSWSADAKTTYQVNAFAISDFEATQILSTASHAFITAK